MAPACMCVCFQSQVSATEEIVFSVIVQLKMGAHKRATMGMDFFGAVFESEI